MTMQRPFAERAASCTTAGRRPVNEDAVLLACLEPGLELVAVADGMGGHEAGEIASNRALEVLHSAIASGEDLVAAVRAANLAVCDEAVVHPEYRGMGTTLVAALRQNGRYMVVNAGDSRAYRIDASGVRQLTEDNSFVAEAVRSGQLTEAEAVSSPWRNAVTRCLGTERELEIDSYGPYDAAGHTLLLCTDGVYRVLSGEVVRRILLDAPDPGSAVRGIAAAAYEAGSEDNISVAVIEFEPVQMERRALAGGPPKLIVPALERKRHRRVTMPGAWALVRALAFLAAAVWTLAYIVTALSS